MATEKPWPRWQSLHVVKAGNGPAEYEDAFAANPARARFAVGASEASFAANWARLLAQGFIDAPDPGTDLDWLAPARLRWSAEVDGLPVPWYAEAKREMGAYATLLGVAFSVPTPDRQRAWRAVAVGDSCLFHTREGRLLASFPLSRSDDFGNAPQLIGSRPSPNGTGGSQDAGGSWCPGDRFLLMTDALAQWFLHEVEKGGQAPAEVAAVLAEPDPQASFPAWVEARRASGLRNDDITLLVIDL